MFNIPFLMIGFITLVIISFVVGININYYNKPALKFSADNECHLSDVKFSYINVF